MPVKMLEVSAEPHTEGTQGFVQQNIFIFMLPSNQDIIMISLLIVFLIMISEMTLGYSNWFMVDSYIHTYLTNI